MTPAEALAEMRRLVADLDAHHREVREAYSRGRADALAELRDFGALMWKSGYDYRDRQIMANHRRLALEVLGASRNDRAGLDVLGVRSDRGSPVRLTPEQFELIMWGGRREDFGKPRPGDFPGRDRSGQEVA